MPEHVVAKFVAHNKQRFISGCFPQCSVPDHHAFRRSNPGHVGIDGVGFLAGLHQKHAVRWNWHSGTLRQLSDRRHQPRVLALEGPLGVRHDAIDKHDTRQIDDGYRGGRRDLHFARDRHGCRSRVP